MVKVTLNVDTDEVVGVRRIRGILTSAIQTYVTQMNEGCQEYIKHNQTVPVQVLKTIEIAKDILRSLTHAEIEISLPTNDLVERLQNEKIS